MKPINLGKTESGEDVNVDFEKEGIRFVLLAGKTGSGKSIFHNHMYRDLMAKYTPEEVEFIFMDMTQMDFLHWDPWYLVMPTIVKSDEALRILENLNDEKRMIFVHIEECDMVYADRALCEQAIEKILSEKKNIFLVYSTSRIDPGYLTDWIKKFVDLRVIFQVRSEEDSEILLGNHTACSLMIPGERILAYHDTQIKCLPFLRR